MATSLVTLRDLGIPLPRAVTTRCLKLQESNRKLEEAHQLLQSTKSECQELSLRRGLGAVVHNDSVADDAAGLWATWVINDMYIMLGSRIAMVANR